MAEREDPTRYYQKLAERNVCDGVQYEPRLWWAELVFAAGGLPLVTADQSIFYNGDEFPTRITHITAAMRPGTPQSPEPVPLQGDERLIQRFGLRVQSHDTFYQNSLHIPMPLWHNVCTAGMAAISPGYSSVRFERPFPLGQRQSWQIDAQLETTPAEPRTVGVTFDGKGRTSKRPYAFASVISLADTTTGSFDPMDLRSQGGEVVDIEGMSLFCSAEAGANDAAGDIRQLRVAIRQTGNGTQQQWEQGAIGPGASPLAPAVLWGIGTGRAVVHQLPFTGPDVRGWLVQPGQGFTVSMLNLDPARQAAVEEAVWLGFYGYTVIT